MFSLLSRRRNKGSSHLINTEIASYRNIKKSDKKKKSPICRSPCA